MIHHVVMLNLKPDAPRDELTSVMDGLATLVGRIDGFVSFEHGPNRDFEGKSADYPYGFVGRFTDAAAVDRYANDPRHQALGGRLVAMCDGGAAGVMVYDIETGGRA